MGKKIYKNCVLIKYYSERFDKTITVPRGYWSDGATGAVDLSGKHLVYNIEENEYQRKSQGFLVHDVLKEKEKWDDGSECTNLQASWVLKDILKAEGRWVRDFWWFISTFAWGEFTKLVNKVGWKL
jgi:hypothetical protein